MCSLPSQESLDNLTFPRWKQAYYDEIIKVDERRFLEGEALDVLVRVAPGVSSFLPLPSLQRIWYELCGRASSEK